MIKNTNKVTKHSQIFNSTFLDMSLATNLDVEKKLYLIEKSDFITRNVNILEG